MTRLGGVEWPRICYWRSADVVPDIGVEASNFAILGQEWFFQRPEFVSAVLDEVRVQFDLERNTWGKQRRFLVSYICSLFGTTDQPAWVTVMGVRKGFARRMQEEGVRQVQAVQLVGQPILLAHLRSSTTSLNGQPLAMRGFLSVHPLTTQKPVWLQRVSVVRSLPGTRGPLVSREHRLVTMSRDPEDFKLASRGFIPAIELYRDHEDVHRSPLISFSRLDRRGTTEHRCFSLHPTIGYVGDVRAISYDPEYYLRSDMLSHTVLERLLTEGEYESF